MLTAVAPWPEVSTGALRFTSPEIGAVVRMPKDRSPVTLIVPPLWISEPCTGASMETPAESLPSVKIEPLLVMVPTNGEVPVTRMLVRAVPWARGSSNTPSALLSVGVKSSMFWTVPVLVKLPVTPPLIWTVVLLLTLLICTTPALETALLLFRIRAGPAVVRLICAPELMVTSSGWPLLAVAVWTAVLCVPEMVVAAPAGVAATASQSGPRATAANKEERMDNSVWVTARLLAA